MSGRGSYIGGSTIISLGFSGTYWGEAPHGKINPKAKKANKIKKPRRKKNTEANKRALEMKDLQKKRKKDKEAYFRNYMKNCAACYNASRNMPEVKNKYRSLFPDDPGQIESFVCNNKIFVKELERLKARNTARNRARVSEFPEKNSLRKGAKASLRNFVKRCALAHFIGDDWPMPEGKVKDEIPGDVKTAKEFVMHHETFAQELGRLAESAKKSHHQREEASRLKNRKKKGNANDNSRIALVRQVREIDRKIEMALAKGRNVARLKQEKDNLLHGRVRIDLRFAEDGFTTIPTKVKFVEKDNGEPELALGKTREELEQDLNNIRDQKLTPSGILIIKSLSDHLKMAEMSTCLQVPVEFLQKVLDSSMFQISKSPDISQMTLLFDILIERTK
ncbi:hypothetical protein [Cohaesibacter marisflavi]|uniref:hypothetical protein n=1 Tax=Cohaesibacter marisflavi TaxID=655353 RepID=UPI0029C649BA|nr:hypothetical protein [Cohaesibacter marisflavi]